MNKDIEIPQTTVAEWRSLIADKSGCDEQTIDDVLERHGVEVNSIVPRRKTILLRSVRLSGVKSGLKDQHQADLPDRPFDYTWKDLDRGLWIITSDKNSKGKSSVLNTFKAAIKGKFPGSMKPDVWNWLSMLRVEFSVDGVLHRVTSKKGDGKGDENIAFLASLERQESGEWLILSTKQDPDAFEEVMSDFFMQELGFEKFRAFQKRTEGFKHHGWPSMGSALFLTGASDALFGEETADGLAMRLLQLFIGLPWISTYTELQASLKKVEADTARIGEATKAPRTKLLTRIAQLETERTSAIADKKALPDRDLALIEKKAADEEIAAALEEKVRCERELIELRGQILEAKSASAEAKNLLQQVKDEVGAGHLFRSLRPKSCPSCDAAVRVNEAATEQHHCSLCGQEPVVPDDDSAERIAALKREVTGSASALSSLEQIRATKESALTSAKARLHAAEERQRKASDILRADDRGHEVATRLVGLDARIQELQEQLPEEPKLVASTDARVLKSAFEVTKECFEGMQTSMLRHFSERLYSIAAALGVENLQSVEVKLNKIGIRQGNTETTFTKLNEGEKLRFRTAAALAAIETAKWTGVGRHPGFVVLDSPAAQEMSEDDFASLLANLTSVLEANPDMQIIVGAVMRPKIQDVPCRGMEYAKGDDHLF
ncbi:hypothetical protein CVM73_22085 [Bradyrhizobium forestalis]|uniref:Large ATP-binding protein n=1 Tax=Bradyrhizobium forestalis TaxID=1419263 RepID=A0A2M8R5H8_9BRAD|nr:hypothetical protein [Bradyrhizobium forestalis]PJG53074.1 hypothetical protein CVM73_22085 [Bradyrhizobium forestalis]